MTLSTLHVSPSPCVRLWGGLGGSAKHPHLLGSGYLPQSNTCGEMLRLIYGEEMVLQRI